MGAVALPSRQRESEALPAGFGPAARSLPAAAASSSLPALPRPNRRHFPCCPDRYVFHGVHMMLQFGSSAEGLGKPWQPGQPRFNRVVFIGAPSRPPPGLHLIVLLLHRQLFWGKRVPRHALSLPADGEACRPKLPFPTCASCFFLLQART